MSIRDLGYRAYDGPRLPLRNRYRVMVWRALASAWSGSRLLRMLLILSPLPAVIFGVVMYLGLKAAQLTGGAQILADAPSPAELVYHCYFSSQIWFSFVISMIVAAPAVADDLRTGAFEFYFSRPVSRTQYLLGRTLPAALLVALVSSGPALLLVLFRLSLCRSGAELWDNLPLLGQVLLFAPLYTAAFSLVPLALGSLSRHRGAVRGIWATVFFFGWMLGEGLAEAANTEVLRLIALPFDLRATWQVLFDVHPEVLYLHPALPPLALGLYLLLAGALLYRRLDRAGVAR